MTEAFKEKIQQKGRTFRGRLINTADREEIIDSGIFSIKSYAQSNEDTDSLTLGGTVSSYIQVEVYKPGIRVTGKEFEYQIGLMLDDGTYEYIPIGMFTAQKPTEDDGLVSFTAYDRFVSRLEHLYTSALAYPADGKNVLKEIQNQSGVRIADIESLPNGITIPKRAVISEEDKNGNTTTTYDKPFNGFSYREAIGYLALMYGKFATMNAKGEVALCWYTDAEYRIESDKSLDDIVCAETQFEVQYVQCSIGENSENVLISGGGTTGINVNAPVMTQSILNSVFAKVKGMKYLPTSLTFLGDPRLELGDIVTVVKRDGTEIQVPIMMLNLEYDGGLTNEIGSFGDTEESGNTSGAGPVTKRMDRVYSELLLVKEVVATKASIGHLEANYAQISELTAINAKIEKLNADKASVDYLQANYATVTKMDAVEADIEKLSVQKASVEYLEANYAKISQLNALEARIDQITSTEVTTEYLEANYAQISMANVDTASIKQGFLENLMVDQGIIADRVVSGEVVATKTLTGVSLYADDITAGTLAVDRLILRGNDKSLVYALNNSGDLVSQQVDTLDAYILTDRTITADKIVAGSITSTEINVADLVSTGMIGANRITAKNILVDDLTAFGATIGGFTIGTKYLANNTTTLAGASDSVYVGLDGISCGDKFKVTHMGILTAAQADITGKITASSGKIGGFTIGTKYFANNTTTLAGASDSVYVGLDGISCGESFYVTANGYVNATGSFNTVSKSNDGIQYYCRLSGYSLNIEAEDASGNMGALYTEVTPGFINVYTDKGGDLSRYTVYSWSGIDFRGSNWEQIGSIGVNDTTLILDGIGTGGIALNGRTSIGECNSSYMLTTSSFLCTSWVRTTGQTGWYNETFGGGWYMADSTYIRNYNSKHLLLSGHCYFGSTSYYINNTGGARLSTLNLQGNMHMKNAGNLYWYDTSGVSKVVLELNSSNNVHVGAQGNANNMYLHTIGYELQITNEKLSPSNGKFPTLGASGNYRWGQIYSTKSAISTSDRNEKRNITEIPDVYVELFQKIQPKAFMFKGGDRIHIGAVAQDVEDAMKELGITDKEFGGFCKDEVIHEILDENGDPTGTEKILDENGNVQYTYGLRYEEFIMLTIHVLQKTILKMEGQKEQLETMRAQLCSIQSELQQAKIEIERLKAVA